MPHAVSSTIPKLSVITVTHNSASVLPELLRSLTEHLPDAEVVVVDNGSSDGTVEIASRSAGVRVVVGHGNVGFGAGVNLGARAARGELLLMLNPDAPVVEVDHAALHRLAQASVVGLAGCRFRDHGRHHYLMAGQWGWRAELYWALTRWFLVPREVTLRRPAASRWRAARWIGGAAFVVRRSEFLGTGGFDERLFLYFEDFELARTYRARSLPIRTTSAVTVSHAGQASSPRDETTVYAWALLSLVQYVHKWEGIEAATQATKQCLRLLAIVAAVGSRLQGVPWLGPRASRKGQTVERVRTSLTTAARSPPSPGAYPEASMLVRAVSD